MRPENINIPWGDPEKTSISSSASQSPENVSKEINQPSGLSHETAGATPDIKSEKPKIGFQVVEQSGVSEAGVLKVGAEKVVQTKKTEQKEKTGGTQEEQKPVEAKSQKEPQKTEQKSEKKEDVDIQKLKAAEVLCLIDLKTASKEEYPEILKRLEKEYSKDVIEKAAYVAEVREKGILVYEQAVKEQKTSGKEKSLSQISKENQRAGKREYDFFERDNFYDPAIMDLKVALLNEKEQRLREWIKEDPFLSKLSTEEKEADINKKLLEYEATYLSRLVITEKSRDQEIRVDIHFAEKMRGAGILQKSFMAFARLPRGVRSVIGAAVFGAGVAVFAPSFVIGAVPTYLAYRAGRALFGGAIAAGLQKLFGNKLVNAAYEKDVNKSFEKLSKQVKGDMEFKAGEIKEGKIKAAIYKLFGRKEKLQDIKESAEKIAAEEKEVEEGLKVLKDLIAMRKYEEIAKLNMKIAGKQLRELEKHTKFRRWNTMAMMTATGIIGGVAGANLFDYLAGPKVAAAIFESKTSGKPVGVPPPEDIIKKPPQEIFENVPPKIIGPTPDQLQQATVGRGEGVWHVTRRQLEVDPAKWGFKGNINNAAALREWSDIRTHQILIEEGYVNPKTGFETRVFDLGPEGPKGNPAYLLEQDASGKPNIREFLGDKPTGGKGVMNVYEYPEPGVRPKMTDILEQKKGGVPVVEEMDTRPMVKIPMGGESIVTTDVPTTGKIAPEVTGEAASFVEAPTISLAKEEIISNLQDNIQPALKETAGSFNEFSLLKQEQLLNSQEVYDFGQHMRTLKGMLNITDADAEIMGEANKYWSQITDAYNENLRAFTGAVREGTGLVNEKSAEVFLGTKIGSVWDAYRGDDQVLDFVKSVNPTSDELMRQLTVGEILKSRFLDGEFAETKIAGAPGWVE